MGNQTRPAAQASIIPTRSSTDRHRACSFRTGSGSVFSTSLWWCLGLISWYSRGLRGVHAEPQNLRVKLRPAAEAPWFVVAVTQLCAVPAFLRGLQAGANLHSAACGWRAIREHQGASGMGWEHLMEILSLKQSSELTLHPGKQVTGGSPSQRGGCHRGAWWRSSSGLQGGLFAASLHFLTGGLQFHKYLIDLINFHLPR